jgi:DNA-binding NtrC family response regulator
MEDIPLLVRAFVHRFARDQGKRIEQIPQPVIEELTGYHWPGNVRELENVVERAAISTNGNKLRLAARLSAAGNRLHDSDGSYKGSLEEVERDYITSILELAGWRIEGKGGAAERLKLHPNTLRFRMRKLGIKRPKAQTSNVRP